MNDDIGRNEVAAERMEMIAPLLSPGLTKHDRSVIKKELAEHYNVSTKTVHRYYMKYLGKGYEGLLPAKQDRSGRRVIPEEVLKEAIEMRKQLPTRSVKDIIFTLESEGVIENKGDVKRSTLQKNLEEQGYSCRQMSMRTFASDTAVLRFQKSHRMQLVQADIKYGPVLKIKGKAVQTYWIGWIDDYSRYILGDVFYDSQKALDVLNSFRGIIEAYGKPVCIYCDNGKQYVSKCLRETCARLGIRLLRHLPRACSSKGKVERANGDIDNFVQECALEKIKSLDELNRKFIAWLEIKHQDSPHSALNGRTPREVFDSDAAFTPLVHVSKEDLDKAFLQTCKRKVSKDGTVSLHGRKYEVGNLLLRGFRVLVSYRPDTLQVVSVSCPGFEDTTARPVVIGENIDYEARGKERQRVLEMKTVQGKPKEGSRVLDACMTEYGKRHPDAGLCVTAVEECEEVRHTEPLPIDFSRLNSSKEAGHV